MKDGSEIGRRAKRAGWLLAAGVGLALLAAFAIPREALVRRGRPVEESRAWLTGDEPGYLMTAQAIAAGDGLDVHRVREAETWRLFDVRPPLGAKTWRFAWYEAHGVRSMEGRRALWEEKGWQICHRPPLIAAFAAPFVRSAGSVRWRVLFAQGVAVAGLLALGLGLSGVLAGRWRWLAAWAAVAVFAGLPVAYYTAEIFPEVLMSTLLLAAILVRHRAEGSGRRVLAYLLAAACLEGNARIVPMAAACSVLWVWQDLRERRWGPAAVLAAGWAAFVGLNLYIWGTPLVPNADPSTPLTPGLVPRGLPRNFLNRDMGLFWLNPALAGMLVAAGVLSWRHRRAGWAWALAAGWWAMAGVVAGFPAYRAGTCPMGRYQVAQAILLLAPLLVGLREESAGENAGGDGAGGWTRRLPGAAGAAGMVVGGAVGLAMAFFVTPWPHFWFRHYHPLFTWPQIRGVYAWLPDFSGGPFALKALAWAAAWAAVLLALGWAWRAAARERPDAPGQG